MATAATPETKVESEFAFPTHRITVERFERMIEAGVFGADDRIFLWEGRLVEKMTPGLPHVYVVTVLQQQFARLVPDGWYCLQEQPIAVGLDSMPEPDLAVVRGALRDGLARRPTAHDASVVVEVSDSSIAIDSGEKLRAYAAEGVPVYWIVDVSNDRIEVHEGPSGPTESPRYRERRIYDRGGLVPVVLDGREVGRIAVDAVFP